MDSILRRPHDRIPIGPWSKDPITKDIGRYNLLNMLEGMVGLIRQISQLLASICFQQSNEITGWIYHRPIHKILGSKSIELSPKIPSKECAVNADGLVRSGAGSKFKHSTGIFVANSRIPKFIHTSNSASTPPHSPENRIILIRCVQILLDWPETGE